MNHYNRRGADKRETTTLKFNAKMIKTIIGCTATDKYSNNSPTRRFWTMTERQSGHLKGLLYVQSIDRHSCDMPLLKLSPRGHVNLKGVNECQAQSM